MYDLKGRVPLVVRKRQRRWSPGDRTSAGQGLITCISGPTSLSREVSVGDWLL